MHEIFHISIDVNSTVNENIPVFLKRDDDKNLRLPGTPFHYKKRQTHILLPRYILQ